MKTLRAYKTEIDPNNQQRTALLQHAGAARKAYNWGLRRKIDTYLETGKSPSAMDLHRELNVLKDVPEDEGGFPWMRLSSKCAPQEALRDLDKAFANFFRRCKTGAKRKGFPRFKRRKRGIGGFRLTGAIKATATHVQLPRLGHLKLKERGYLPAGREGIRVLSASVTEKAGRWFVSLQVEEEVQVPTSLPEHVIGVDVGIAHLAVTSDGQVFDNPRALYAAEKRQRMLQKAVSRKQKGSQNRRKAVARLARQHCRVGNLRKDSLHKTSSAIAKSASVIVLESLNVAGMVKNHRLARALSDASMAELQRQIEYKAAWRGARVFKADRFFPSSKLCSACGVAAESLPLSVRTWTCDVCGAAHDRDRNAAINLRNLAVSSTAAARRPGSAGASVVACVKLLAGREPNTDQGLSLIGSV